MIDVRKPYDLHLDCYENDPVDERPTFTFRRLNGPEFEKLQSVFDIDGERVTKAVYDSLRVGLIGWKFQSDPSTGTEVPFDPSKLEQVIDPQQAFDLIEKRLARGRVNKVETNG